MSVCLFICLLCLFVSLFVCSLFLHMSVCLFICLLCLFVCLFVCSLFLYMSVCLFICLLCLFVCPFVCLVLCFRILWQQRKLSRCYLYWLTEECILVFENDRKKCFRIEDHN